MIVIIGGIYAGGRDYAERSFPGCPVIDGYDAVIRDQMRSGADPLNSALDYIRSLEDNSVVVLTEMGCGIVPMDRGEREFREMNGRVNCLFAEKAERVIRVVAGVGQVLK